MMGIIMYTVVLMLWDQCAVFVKLWFIKKIYKPCLEHVNLPERHTSVCVVGLPVEFVEVWEISGLLSLLEVGWVLGWTWIAWSCWGTPGPGETQRAKSHYGKSSNTSPRPRRAAVVC